MAGEEREIAGRVWVLAMAVESLPGDIGEGDVVVVGDRPDAQRRAVELGVALLVTSNGTRAVRRGARARPRARHDRRLLAAGQLRDEPHGHAVGAVPGAHERRAADRAPRRPARRRRRGGQRDRLPRGDRRRRPAPARSGSSPTPSSPTPSRAASCSSTTPRRPRACPASSRPRSSRSSTTTTSARSRRRSRSRATFDPVGSTATLVVERFRQNGMEPTPADGDDAARRRAVGHGDPQLAHDDRARQRRRRVPRARARRSTPRTSGARCSRRPPTCRASTPTTSSAATPRSTTVGEGRTICIAQIETVGLQHPRAPRRAAGGARAPARGARTTFCAR